MWKKHVKEKIRSSVEKKSDEMKKTMKKLRHQLNQDFRKQPYIMNTSISCVPNLLRVKLEMLDIGKNIGGDSNRICLGCKRDEEKTEHITKCHEAKALVAKDNNKINTDNMKINSEKNDLWRVYRFIKNYMNIRDNV